MKQKWLNVLILILIGVLYSLYYSDHHKYKYPKKLIKEQPKFLLSDNPEKDLMAVLEYYNVKYKHIVHAQAILETGYFKSRVYKEYNNLFGLYDSYNKDYYKFNHWSESVVAYLNYIQYKYKPPCNYYVFLVNIGYAEDPDYVTKLKTIVKRHE